MFDLDGTLYDDTHQFDFQANVLKEKLPSHKQSAFIQDYLAVKRGDHPLKVGRVYDVNNDLILVQMDGWVFEAYNWDGTRLSEEEIRTLYEKPIILNFETMVHIGDPWWIPTSIAAHYGLNRDECYDAFLKTREYMMGPNFTLNPIEGLKEALELLRGEIQFVLLTNSHEQDGEMILQKIGLHDLFSLKIFDGMKPIKTVDHFQFIKNHFQVQFDEIVSIGDNWINEIRPVKPLGCYTVFIDPYQIGDDTFAHIVVDDLRKIIPVFREFTASIY